MEVVINSASDAKSPALKVVRAPDKMWRLDCLKLQRSFKASTWLPLNLHNNYHAQMSRKDVKPFEVSLFTPHRLPGPGQPRRATCHARIAKIHHSCFPNDEWMGLYQHGATEETPSEESSGLLPKSVVRPHDSNDRSWTVLWPWDGTAFAMLVTIWTTA